MTMHLTRTLRLAVAASLLFACFANEISTAQEPPTTTPVEGPTLYNVSTLELGATAKGSGAPFNKDWPPNGTLQAKDGRGGTLMGGPMTGGRIDIRLIVPVDIKAIEVVPLDYRGTQQPKTIDIFVEDKLVKSADLVNSPGKPIRIPLEAKGQNVGILITEAYPEEMKPDGTKGPNYGGWSRLRILSSTNVPEMLKPVDNHDVKAAPENIAPTGGTLMGNKVEVVGEPRVTKGHPNTLWDAEDIAHYKKMLATSKELQAQFAGLKNSLDVRITQPLGIPQPEKGDDGKWKHFSDQAKLGESTYGAVHNQLSLDIANLGTVYAFTGDEKYAEYCKKLLLAYADAYPNYGVGARPGFSHAPSKAFDQILGDSIWFPQIARGYDLIYNLPSITPEERRHIHDNLMKAVAQAIVGSSSGVLRAPTNWSAISTMAVLMAGAVTDDEELVNTALYGKGGTKEKPNGGLFESHFGTKSIDADGMWSEGAMGYQFMALQALIVDAEVLWHRGIDMYRYRDGALKRLFDSPMEFSYPDLTTPAQNDSSHGSVIGADSYLYEYAYRRYRDPKYLSILNQIGTHLNASYQQFPISVLYDRNRNDKVAAVEWKSVNFFGVGNGVLRLSTEAGTNSLMLDYGPAGSHGHPDKMSVDLYAFNDQLLIDPGSIWYERPLYRRWYRTTLAHNTLVVDELDQVMAGGVQLVYGPAETFGLQRASTTEAYPGVTMDRSVFLTPDYYADLFGAFARLPRKMDLAWHIRGSFASDLDMQSMVFPEPAENGYNELKNARHTETDKPWSARIERAGNTARFLAAGGTDTDVIVADGYYGVETPPTILQRRTTNNTIFGNAVDISGAKDGYVKSVTQEGGLDAGFGMLKVTTAKGTDLCFASFRPGSHKAGELETDAQQAFVLMDGRDVRAMYLGGGKSLKVGASKLERSVPGLTYLEKAETGAYILANPSPADAEVTATLASLSGMDAFALAADGSRTGPAKVTKGDSGALTLSLPASARVEFAPKNVASVYDFRQAMLKKRQDEQEAAIRKARDEYLARNKIREGEADSNPAPANTMVVVAAPAFTAEGNGNVNVTDKKRAAVGPSFSGWNDAGHWLEWTFEVPADGYYNLTVCYCSQMDQIEREIKVDGEVQEPFAPMNFPGTGGWANGSDDWRLYTASNPGTEEPLLIKLKKGKNLIRLTNLNGRGLNVNYLAITSPDVKVTREELAAKLVK